MRDRTRNVMESAKACSMPSNYGERRRLPGSWLNPARGAEKKKAGYFAAMQNSSASVSMQ
ncbi:hypothetical protein [Paraburkholderia sp. RL17-337-BIB-A]|uniref:hypothetical protein n=1 Tax=Paraburkholderia sp. RL17-337-BIB-A TaxID=3031636 RepID=UPI0038B6E07D